MRNKLGLVHYFKQTIYFKLYYKKLNNQRTPIELKAETMTHFMQCSAYSVENHSKQMIDWKSIYENNMDKQLEVAIEVERRFKIRETLLEEAGLDSPPGSQLRTCL